MAEPIRRVNQKTTRGDTYAQEEPYATDVLLIADSAGPDERESRSGGAGHATSEPLDMESVVRKLIALLSDQQP